MNTLLRNIKASRNEGEFAFVTLPDSQLTPKVVERSLAMFRESEGVTLVLRVADAHQAGFSVVQTWSWITCEVNSDLMAVGFLAAICSLLADHGIPCNPISAYHHDHLFTPSENAEQALKLLNTFEHQ